MSETSEVQTKQAEAAGESPQRTNLEAIMHVPLDISVELGRTQMPLHNIARLNHGMVIELDKEANAQVNILANGTIFARGEVVSTGNKLGVRITEVVPASARVSALS
ncbi:MAG: flagellar motor switch protein FliN [Mariprofundaceae bacterium]